MEEARKTELLKAQEITFHVDLFNAAKQQLRFLAVVDSMGCLYDGPALERAVYRYKNCWLPLLAKHVRSSVFEGPLVVPLDCEWIWHCHRLNPVQYKRDCEDIYGRILGTLIVMSIVELEPSSKQTESIWNRIYVTEPYNLDLANVELPISDDDEVNGKGQKSIDYDLVAAVKRQSSFFGKVLKEINDTDVDSFLEEAIARYKGFLHLTKTVRERDIELNCVPTRDIDLIWHTHQLYPSAYYRDLKAIHGTILDHNDRDIESGKRKKMELLFLRTKQLWEETFGNTYLMESGAKNKNMEDNSISCRCAGDCEGSCNKNMEDNSASCRCAGDCEGSRVSNKHAEC